MRQNLFFYCLGLCCLSVLLLGGCAHMVTEVKQPTISLSALHPEKVSPLETVFNVELRVMNPNDFALDIQGVNCKIKINGNHFATGISNTRQEIPPYGAATIAVTIYASTFDMVGSMVQFLQQTGQDAKVAPLHYELSGTVHLGGYGQYPFNSTGDFNFSQ